MPDEQPVVEIITPVEPLSPPIETPDFVTVWLPLPRKVREMVPTLFQFLRDNGGDAPNFPKNEKEFMGQVLAGSMITMYQQIQAAQRRIIIPPGMEGVSEKLQELRK